MWGAKVNVAYERRVDIKDPRKSKQAKRSLKRTETGPSELIKQVCVLQLVKRAFCDEIVKDLENTTVEIIDDSQWVETTVDDWWEESELFDFDSWDIERFNCGKDFSFEYIFCKDRMA